MAPLAAPSPSPEMLGPGATIGILGGGQLGRMLALAGARLGLKSHIYCPDPGAPAAQVSAAFTQADYGDEDALGRFAEAVDAITYEFENVPAETVGFLAGLKPVRPGVRALKVAQDRLQEKTFLNGIGVATAPFAAVASGADLTRALERIGLPSVLKTRRFGYDGKGQVMLKTAEDRDQALAVIGHAPAVLEGFVAFEREISVIVARDAGGGIAAYDASENQHEDHILARSIVPARINPQTAEAALEIARKIAGALDYVGVMGVEMFETAGTLIVNEIAPRVHNSGHWTMNACLIDQFEQHMRAVAGWPLGSTQRHSDAVMENLIGDAVESWSDRALSGNQALHLYGKAEARPGRKMGHVTTITPRTR